RVQVGWYDRQWHTCWAAFIPYPCYDNVWTTAEKYVSPQTRSIDVKLTSAYGLADLAQRIACGVGFTEVGGIQLCQQNLNTIADNFLPTLKFPVPYQDVSVPATQWMTNYWWRFSTFNGTYYSNFTGWSSFYRSL